MFVDRCVGDQVPECISACLMGRLAYVMGCAFASMRVCSARERNRHMFMVPHSLGSNAKTSQTDGTFLTGVALTYVDTSLLD